VKVIRFPQNPIIRPDMDGRTGTNVNGPSLIRAPDWLPGALGRYYLYFAHHRGLYVRLAVTDRLEGPWRMHEPGVLPLADSLCAKHVASPDVHVDHERREIRMYYHGPVPDMGQRSRVAISNDGLAFAPLPETIGTPYFRVFRWHGWHWAIARYGHTFRSLDGLVGWECGPDLFPESFRHNAVRLVGGRLSIYYSMIGDCPERILRATVDLSPDWTAWRPSLPEVVLEPELPYEGADLPLRPSIEGWAPERVRQLRDPAIYEEDGRVYLLYSVAGEAGIAIGEIAGG